MTGALAASILACIFSSMDFKIGSRISTLYSARIFLTKSGASLAIGHPYPTTLEALAQFLPQLEKKDVQLVPVSQLLRLPEVARLSPPRRPTP